MQRYFIWPLAAITLFLSPAPAQWIGRPAPAWESGFQAWVADIHKHVFPNGFGRDLARRTVELAACRNEYAAFQLGVRSPRPVAAVAVKTHELASTAGGRLPGALLRVRYPGLIPVDENAQYTPDPLWEVPTVALEPRQSQGIWVDFKIPADTPPGRYQGALEVIADGAPAAEFTIALDVLPVALPDPSGFHAYLNILMDPGSIARFQGLPLWGAEHWRRLEAYIRNLAGHGQKTIVTFIVDDPWDSLTGFPVRTVVDWKFPGEWQAANAARMEYDFSHFDRFVELSLAAGTRDHIEAWSPLVQPHSERSVITYLDTAAGKQRRIELPAGSEEYRAVWGQFARAFQEHLRAKGWLDKTYLAFDEIRSDVLDRVVPFFRQVAPDLKLMISGGDEKGRYTADSRETAFAYESYGAAGEVMPDIPARRRAGKRTLLYTALNPVYPNTFVFSAPLESRYLPWIVWKWGFDGYIRWAWNFWPQTLWDQPLFTWPSGDMFLVYPGPEGPVDSIRWEMLRQGLQDYECLWMAREGLDALRKTGRDPELVKRGERDLARAVTLATRQFHRQEAPWSPLPARIAEARQIVNKLLVSLNPQ